MFLCKGKVAEDCQPAPQWANESGGERDCTRVGDRMGLGQGLRVSGGGNLKMSLCGTT